MILKLVQIDCLLHHFLKFGDILVKTLNTVSYNSWKCLNTDLEGIDVMFFDKP